MTVSVAEYLGQSVSSDQPIRPVDVETCGSVPCPFRTGSCTKVVKGLKPVCSVRDGSGILWIVCEHRLCATSPKDAPLTEYQVDVLMAIANTIWGVEVDRSDIAVRREVPVRTAGRSTSKADYVMVPTPQLRSRQSKEAIGPVILEMQGGGETINTRVLSDHVTEWEATFDATPQSFDLSKPIKKVNALVTNAWRRQQEQFLVKGNVATNSSGRLVFVLGSKLYDLLQKNLINTSMIDLRNGNWSLALLGVSEAPAGSSSKFGIVNSVQLQIDSNRLLFTKYADFVQALTRQGGIDVDLFRGQFITLEGLPINVD